MVVIRWKLIEVYELAIPMLYLCFGVLRLRIA